MTDPYEQFADAFLSSTSGQMSGMNRQEVIALFRSKWPVLQDFEAMIASVTKQASDTIEQAQAQLPPGHVLAVGYPVDKHGHLIRKSPLH